MGVYDSNNRKWVKYTGWFTVSGTNIDVTKSFTIKTPTDPGDIGYQAYVYYYDPDQQKIVFGDWDCAGKKTSGIPSATVKNFVITPSSAQDGDTVTLSWDVEGPSNELNILKNEAYYWGEENGNWKWIYIGTSGYDLVTSSDGTNFVKSYSLNHVPTHTGANWYYVYSMYWDWCSKSWKGFNYKIEYIAVCPSDSFEPDDSSSDAKTIARVDLQTKVICPEGDEDWSKFTLTEKSKIKLETLNTPDDTGRWNTQMWLYDSNLNQIEYDDDDGEDYFSRIIRILDSGTYYVKVNAYSSVGIDYRLRLITKPVLKCERYFGDSSKTKADYILIADDSYNDNGNWLSDLESQLDNIVEEGMFEVHPFDLESNQNKFNIYYLTEEYGTGSIRPDFCENPYNYKLPAYDNSCSNQHSDFKAEIVGVVHRESSNPRECARGITFCFEDIKNTQMHEMGHALFGLADTYCCDGGYWSPSPHPNLWEELTDCNTYSTTNFNKHTCEVFTADSGEDWARLTGP
ncbi:MAG: hypothetical protein CVV33_09995, partial [Methanomicrobiales archaeon HGW-Methanomicrobiales-4]